MDEKRKIDNVNILDIRKATETSIAQTARVENVNVVIYTAETASFLSRLSIGNLNASVEVPSEQVQILMGNTVLSHDFFQNITTPQFLVVLGKLVVESSIQAADIEEKIDGLTMMGLVVCPQNLLGILQSKSKLSVGKMIAYPVLNQIKTGDILLDEHTLSSFEDHTEMAVIGNVTFPNVVSDQLLERKISRLFASDGVRFHEENAAVIRPCLHKDTSKITVIPAGHDWINNPYVLDSLTLSLKKGRKLYCTEKIQIDPDVTPAILDEGLESLVCEELVICPLGLKETLSRKCDLLNTRAVFYEGTLWMVDGEEKLYKSFFEAAPGKLTLVVTGMLTIDPEIEAQTLAERLEKVHNMGMINCRREHIGILQFRMGINKGMIQDSAPQVEESGENENRISNVNYLSL